MSEYSFETLKAKTVAQLREIASSLEKEEVKGYSQLNKEHLLALLCKVLKIDMHVHHEVKQLDKNSVKAKIKFYMEKRREALDAHNAKELKFYRRQLHMLKRRIHKAMS